MPLLIPCCLLILGFVVLIKGADWMVHGASVLAKKYNVSDLTIGLTIVAFGTSAPELVINAIASFDGQSEIIIGNIIGSSNFNLLMILGITAIIYPISVQGNTVWQDIPIALGAVLVFYLLGNGFFIQNEYSISRPEGVVMIILFFAFLYYVYLKSKNEDNEDLDEEDLNMKTMVVWLYILGGMAGLVIGGNLVMDNAIIIATDFGVSKKVIGLTIIAAGTSLPELVTSVVAALKKKSDMAIGSILGSNISNILLIIGVSALIHPIDYDPSFNFDMLMLMAGTFFLFVFMFIGKRNTLGRAGGLIMLGSFISYTIYLLMNN